MTTVQPIRPSPIAGIWYPGDARTLHAQVSQFIEKAAIPDLPGEVMGLIAPHAGYVYSGPTAGYSYRCVQNKAYDLVVIASPLHDYLPQSFITTAHAQYATPLGNVAVDSALLNELGRSLQTQAGPRLVTITNDREHSIEIQLPFLQVALSGPFKLLPLMVREREPALIKQFSVILASLLQGKKVLLVASTDLSHFYPLEQANQLDEHMMAEFRAFSSEGVLRDEVEETGFACGSGAVALMLWTAKALGADQVTLLHHSTSAEATHDRSNVVGYGAAVLTQSIH
jgi:AmmeMemoRadiSam system protein B